MSPARSAPSAASRHRLWTTRRLWPAIAIGAVAAASSIGLLATSAWLITRASLRPGILTLSVAIASVRALAIARALARYLERLAVHAASLDVVGTVRLSCFDDLALRVPGGAITLGGAANAFLADADTVASSGARTVTAAIDVTSSIAFATMLAALVQLRLGMILGIGLVATAASALLVSEATRGLAGRARLATESATSTFVEIASSLPELLAYGREDLVLGAIAEANRASGRAAIGRGVVRGAAQAVIGAGLAVTLLMVLGTGLSLAPGLSGVSLAVVAFVTLAGFEPLVELPAALDERAGGKAAARHLAALGAAPVPAPEPDRPLEGPERPATVVFEDVELGYDAAPPVLCGLDLELAPAASVALMGPSGSGKSTVVHAVAHFLTPRRGRLAIGGVPLGEIGRAALAERVAWSGDEPHVFAATLRANLALADPGADEETLVEICRRVGLGPWFDSLPDGLSSRIGAGGRALSSGERQRLGLARCLLVDADLVVLDEPTAHLDPDDATVTMDAIVRASEGHGLLVTTHDPLVAQRLDHTVALDAS